MATKSTGKSSGTQASKTADTLEGKQNQLPIKATINWLNQNDDENIRATASLTMGDAFAVHGIKVVSGSKGEFVSMPSYKSKNEYKDIFHAITADARQQMNDAIMQAYEQKLAEQAQGENLADHESGVSESAGMGGIKS